VGNGAEFIRGADISSLPRTEAFGGVFTDKGRPRDALAILRDHGLNWVRLRVFVKPDGLWGAREDLPSMVALAGRAKAMGFRVMLTIHCSDTWADPGNQSKPVAWKDMPFPQLAGEMRRYTAGVARAFREGGAVPDMFEIGNEITGGMLWPDGKLWGEGSGGWDRFIALVTAGQDGVRDAPGGEPRFLYHIDNIDKAESHMTELTKRGFKVGLLGVSFYPWWQGKLADLGRNMAAISAKYGVDILVTETAHPWTDRSLDSWGNIFDGDPKRLPDGFPMTPRGQADFTRALVAAVREVPGGRGAGVVWWEPAWIAVPGARDYLPGETVNHDGKGGRLPAYGSCVENACLFDDRGAALPALEALGGGW
jgi:arabinogalactan endo-1,4-beta-galactosidase